MTLKGWRIASLRSDCMIGDFTKMELFINYYDSLYDLMDAVSPGYRQRFGEKLAKKLIMLQVNNISLFTELNLKNCLFISQKKGITLSKLVDEKWQ